MMFVLNADLIKKGLRPDQVLCTSQPIRFNADLIKKGLRLRQRIDKRYLTVLTQT